MKTPPLDFDEGLTEGLPRWGQCPVPTTSRPEARGAQPPATIGDLLASTWPFSELPRSVIAAVRAGMHEQEFAAGEALIRQGEPSRGLIAVVEGGVEVRLCHGGQWYNVAQAGGAVLFGEMGLLTHEPCTATVVAKTPVRALVLPAERFGALASRHHVLRVALGRLIADRLGRVEVDALAGKVLGGHRIKRAVGRGGMAVVYEAQRLADGRRVALKMMSHRYTHDLGAQQRFEREMRICQSLEHPNITRIYGSFTCFGTTFMVMEFCDGAALSQVIRRHGALPQPEVRKVAGQLAAALDYAHRRGICHRDLKPSNVMLDRRGTLKLMDFGLAKAAGNPNLTWLGNVLGTPPYMPPEQLSGRPVDHRADLFAFGSIVYEMLTGQRLFRGADVWEIIQAQWQWTLPPGDQIVPGLGDDLYDLLRRSLAKRPQDRVLDLAHIAAWSAPVTGVRTDRNGEGEGEGDASSPSAGKPRTRRASCQLA